MAKGARAKGRSRPGRKHFGSSARPRSIERRFTAFRFALKLWRLSILSALAIGGLSGLGSVGGCNAEAPPFNPREIERSERLRSYLTTRPSIERIPGGFQNLPIVPRTADRLPSTLPTTGQSSDIENNVSLSLREAIQRAVARSSIIRVAAYDPGINELRVLEAKARFDPEIYANIKFDRVSQQTVSQAPGSATDTQGNPLGTIFPNKTETNSVEGGIHQLLISGGDARLGYTSAYSHYDPGDQFGRSLNPFWENTLKLELTQPLLQNFGTAVNAARIAIARNDQRVSVLQYRQQLETTLSDLEQAYWQLYATQQEVKIQEQLLLQSLQTYGTLFQRWLGGLDASQVQTRQAESAVHARKAALIDARNRVRNLSAQIKQLMNDGEFPVSGPAVIVATDNPLSEPINFNTLEQINTAMNNRFDLAQQLLRIDSTAIAQMVAQNNKLPRLDFTGVFAFNGVGADIGDAFDNQGDFNHFSYSLGLQFSYPIGNRAAIAIYRRSMLQRQQAIEQYRALVAQASLEVQTALNDIYSNWEQVIARQQSRLAVADQLRLLQAQEDVIARLTPEFVNVKLQAQQDLANAAREEANAVSNYNISIQRLERAKGTLLRYNNVQMEEERLIAR